MDDIMVLHARFEVVEVALHGLHTCRITTRGNMEEKKKRYKERGPEGETTT
jgi:hypothetical protein